MKTLLSCLLVFGCAINKDAPAKEVPVIKKQNGRLVRIGVIDTGFDFISTWPKVNKSKFAMPKLCKTGHTDFTGTGIRDVEGHGTHIGSLIAQGNMDVNYCIVVLKFWNPGMRGAAVAEIAAIERAIELKVDIINMSLYGSEYIKAECDVLKKALDAGIKVVAAAGNEHQDISVQGAFPATCDSRIVKVVNIDSKGKLHRSSNYSTIHIPNLYTVVGTDVYGLKPNNKFESMTGTSQAAAVFTSSLIREVK